MKTDDGRPMIFMCDSRGVGVSNGSTTAGTVAQQNRFLEMLRADVKADDGGVSPYILVNSDFSGPEETRSSRRCATGCRASTNGRGPGSTSRPASRARHGRRARHRRRQRPHDLRARVGRTSPGTTPRLRTPASSSCGGRRSSRRRPRGAPRSTTAGRPSAPSAIRTRPARTSVHFSGRLGNKELRPGRYRLKVVAGLAGLHSAPLSKSFVVARSQN